MNKKPNYSKWKERQKEPPKMRKIRLEIFDDGIYVGTIKTDHYWDDKLPIAEEELMEYVQKKFPTRKKKYLTIRIV